MIRLKSLHLKQRFFQSPMAGCTDPAFRWIARQHGLELAFTEMISAEALSRKSKKTELLLRKIRGDTPLGAQIVGHKPSSMGEAAAIIETSGMDILDLNFGCPVRKITGPGGGSALLQRPVLAQKIFKSVMRQIKKIPVTVKMRTGFLDPSGQEALRIAKIAEECGLSAVTIHGRTRTQGYTGKADWSIIGLIKKAVTIPVFGNGDIFAPEDALRMLEQTGCDGIAIGRGALGNPWLYEGILSLFRDKKPPTPTLEEKKRTALQHIRLEIKFEGEKNGVLQSRKIACWYFKGCSNVAQLREKINTAKTLKVLEKLIEDFDP